MKLIFFMLLFIGKAVAVDFISPSNVKHMPNSKYYKEVIPVKFSAVNLFENEELNLQLKEDIKITAKREYFRNNVWRGKVVGDPYGLIIIKKNTNGYSVNIYTGGKQYWSRFYNGSYFLIESIGLEELSDGLSDNIRHIDESDVERASNAEVNSKSSDDFIDVMIVYTAAAAALDANIESTLAARVATINGYLEDSCVNYRYRLVHTQQVAYTENAAGILTDLGELYSGASFGNGSLSALNSLKETHGADLVQMITDNSSESSYCGIAYTNEVGNYNDVKSASVSQYDCGPLTMAHEFGHNLGLQHDLYQDDIDSSGSASFNYEDGYGFVDLENKKRSIMSYNTHCSDEGFYCERLGVFSSARKMIKGLPFGVGGEADAVGHLNRNFGYVANFTDKASSYSPSIDKNCVSVSDTKDIHCFIATAAMGSYMQDDVQILRSFRDKFLKTSDWGMSIINFYYNYSPYLAKKIRENSSLKQVVRFMIKVTSVVIENPIGVISAALMITCTFFFGFNKFVCVVVALLMLLSFNVKADIAVPSVFANKVGANPATRLLIQNPILLAIDYRSIGNSGEGSRTSTKEEGTLMNLLVGSYTPQFFLESRLYSVTKTEKVESNEGISDISRDIERSDFLLQVGGEFRILGQMGLKYKTEKVDESEDFLTSERVILGIGKMGIIGDTRFGIGFDYITESGESLAEAKWIETYFSGAIGNYSGASGYLFEYALRRRPKVIATDDTNVNYYGAKLTHQLVYETADLKFSPLLIDLVRFSYTFDSESAVSPYTDEELKSSEFGIAFGGAVSVIRGKYMFEYLTKTIDDSLSSKETSWLFNLSWGFSRT